MIHFFRRIRQRLLSEGKATRYLLYAIGEIALVMIGILLALQVNNWNEGRKENNLEQTYLVALKQEFQDNLKEVDRVIKLNAKVFTNAQKLANYTGPGNPTISEKEFSQLYFGIIGSEVQYRPGTGVINEIISSGKLNIFREPELKKALASLDGLLLRIRFQETNELADVRMKISELVQSSNVSARKMAFDAFRGMFEIDGGRFPHSSLSLLKSVPFDNRLTRFVFTAGFMNQRYTELKNEIERIITIIDNQIKP